MSKLTWQPTLLTWAIGLAVALALVTAWWGAAVTSEDVGLAVPDWPLCYNEINPHGWTGVPALLLEHGHRNVGSILGLATLLAFTVQWALAKRRPSGIFLLVGLFTALLGLLTLAGKQAAKDEPASVYYVLAGLVASVLGLWLLTEWFGRAGVAMKLASTAIILVVMQACLGGIRVLLQSDPFAIFHGILAQIFFCVIWTWFLISREPELRVATYVRVREYRVGCWMSGIWLTGVLLQLLLAVCLRHSQRLFLVSNDVFTTGGAWIPTEGSPTLWLMFSHKAAAWSLSLLVLGLLILRGRGGKALAKYPLILTLMIAVQIGLGVWVLFSGKHFWPTNFHVIHGMLLLTVSVTYAVAAWRQQPASGLLAKTRETV